MSSGQRVVFMEPQTSVIECQTGSLGLSYRGPRNEE